MMLGYKESDIKEMISGLSGIEGTSDDVESIEKVLDFLDGLLAEGHFDA
jgi:hypothetical protein